MDPSAKISMPVENIFPDDVLGKEFEYRKTVPFGEAALALALPCRTTWKWVEVKSDTKGHYNRFVTLARVEAPGEPEVAIEVKYILLRQEVKLEEWVDCFLDSQEMTAVKGRVGEYQDRHTVDAVAEFKVDDGRTFAARMGFFKNGNRIFLTAGSAPRDKYETWAREFGVAVTGATPQTLLDSEFAEPLAVHAFAEPRKLSFSYPASWTARPISKTPPGVGAVDLFYDEPESPKGLIKVRVYAKDKIPGFDVERATWSVFEEIKEGAPDLEMKEKLSEAPASTKDFPGAGKQVVYSVRLGGASVQVHELVLDGKDTVLSIVLISSAENKARLAHIVNHRAWEIIADHISLGK